MGQHNEEERIRKETYGRMKELHTHSFLTLLSIGQGVAFHMLVEVVHHACENNANLSVVLPQAIFVLLVLILIWNDFYMVVASFTWIPTLRDALVLFSLFSSEVFMVKTIDTNLWFFSLTVLLFFSLLAFTNTYFHAKNRKENHLMMKIFSKRMRLSMISLAVMIPAMLGVGFFVRSYPNFLWIGFIVIYCYVVVFALTVRATWRKMKSFVEDGVVI
ncbi:MAG: hypothetical protein U0V74_13015 [Chitinophagales bacterium]